MTTATAFSVPGSSLGWWHERFQQLGIDVDAPRTRDQEEVLTFRDPDGMVIDLVASDGDHRSGWDGVADIPAEHAVRGLHAITLSERELDPSAGMLTDLLGMSLAAEDGDRARFGMAGGTSGALVDVSAGVKDRGLQAGGTVHHVAFRAPDLATMTSWQQELHRARGLRHPDSRPAVLQVDLLPRTRRGAVRDRHRCPRLRGGRAAARAGPQPQAAAVAGAQPSADRGVTAATSARRRHPVTSAPLDRPHVFLPADESASGPPLLLLHGTGGDEHDLLPLRAALARRRGVVRPGHRAGERHAPVLPPAERGRLRRGRPTPPRRRPGRVRAVASAAYEIEGNR